MAENTNDITKPPHENARITLSPWWKLEQKNNGLLELKLDVMSVVQWTERPVHVGDAVIEVPSWEVLAVVGEMIQRKAMEQLGQAKVQPVVANPKLMEAIKNGKVH